jgi:hypothetical protein
LLADDEVTVANLRPCFSIDDCQVMMAGRGIQRAHQVCLAHVLRDVQYAIDYGDSIFAPKSGIEGCI